MNKRPSSCLGIEHPRFTRRRFTAAMTGIVAATATGFIHAQMNKQPNSFVVTPNSYPGADIEQFLNQVKKTPIRAVELPVGADSIKNLIPEWMVDAPLGGKWRNSLPDLKELLVNGGFRIECLSVAGYMGYPGSERMIKRRIDFAEQLGVKIFNVACDPEIVEKYRAYVYSMLRDVGQYAARKNVCIALETWGGITRNAQESLRTMHKVGFDNVGINFDTGNVLLYNSDMDAALLAEELQQLKQHIVYVHLKDVLRKRGEKPIKTVLGQGEIDFREVFDSLHDASFYGPFGFDLETTHASQSRDICESHKDLLASIEYLRSLGVFNS